MKIWRHSAVASLHCNPKSQGNHLAGYKTRLNQAYGSFNRSLVRGFFHFFWCTHDACRTYSLVGSCPLRILDLPLATWGWKCWAIGCFRWIHAASPLAVSAIRVESVRIWWSTPPFLACLMGIPSHKAVTGCSIIVLRVRNSILPGCYNICWRLLVVKEAEGLRFRSFFSTLVAVIFCHLNDRSKGWCPSVDSRWSKMHMTAERYLRKLP